MEVKEFLKTILSLMRNGYVQENKIFLKKDKKLFEADKNFNFQEVYEILNRMEEKNIQIEFDRCLFGLKNVFDIYLKIINKFINENNNSKEIDIKHKELLTEDYEYRKNFYFVICEMITGSTGIFFKALYKNLINSNGFINFQKFHSILSECKDLLEKQNCYLIGAKNFLGYKDTNFSDKLISNIDNILYKVDAKKFEENVFDYKYEFQPILSLNNFEKLISLYFDLNIPEVKIEIEIQKINEEKKEILGPKSILFTFKNKNIIENEIKQLEEFCNNQNYLENIKFNEKVKDCLYIKIQIIKYLVEISGKKIEEIKEFEIIRRERYKILSLTGEIYFIDYINKLQGSNLIRSQTILSKLIEYKRKEISKQIAFDKKNDQFKNFLGFKFNSFKEFSIFIEENKKKFLEIQKEISKIEELYKNGIEKIENFLQNKKTSLDQEKENLEKNDNYKACNPEAQKINASILEINKEIEIFEQIKNKYLEFNKEIKTKERELFKFMSENESKKSNESIKSFKDFYSECIVKKEEILNLYKEDYKKFKGESRQFDQQMAKKQNSLMEYRSYISLKIPSFSFWGK